MKKIILFFTTVLLTAWICGCTAPSNESSVTSSADESTSSITTVSSEESVLDITEESSESSDTSEETPIRNALTDEEYQRLDAYLTALEEQDLQDKGWQDGYREEKPIFLGIVGNYTLCEWGYYEINLDDLELPEGMSRYYPIFPSYASQCGVYVLGSEHIWKLEETLGVFLTLEEVYDLLTPNAQYFLDKLLNQ